MYANTGYSALWAYSNEDDHIVECDSSPSLTSDSDSAQELHDLEELLYSHVHYEPNYLRMTGTPNGHSCSDVHITQLHDGVLDGADFPGNASEQEIPVTSNSTDNEVVIIDVIPPPDEVRSNTTATSNLFSKQLKRKPVSCKAFESADEIKTKSKKVDAASSPSSIALESTAAKSGSSLNLLDDAAGTERSPGSKKDVGRPDGQYLTKKKLKVKHKSRISHAAAAVETTKPVTVDSENESASDVFCCDLSSDELSSNGADDIKLSNVSVDFPHTSDVDALIDVLNSLPGMLSCYKNS